MNPEDDKELWDLLGKVAEPRVSPFFARNVVREARTQQSARQELFSWRFLRRLVPLAGVAAAIIAAAAVVTQKPAAPPPHKRSTPAATIVQSDSDDADLVSDIDDVVGSDDDSFSDSPIY